MNRVYLALVVPVTAIILTAIWLSDTVEPMEALYDHANCKRVLVTDQRYRALRGIEDIALLGDGTLVLSNYNRTLKGAPARGITTVHISELTDDDEGAFTRAVPGLYRTFNSLSPHGIAADRSGARLAFVNRNYEGDDATVSWGVLTPTGYEERGRWDGEGSCRANDVAWRGAELVVSVDRGSCDWSVSDLMPGAATGRVLKLGFGQEEELLDGLAWANGITLVDGSVVVAETRGNRLVNLSTGQTVELPGGPDNINPGPFETQIIALHPNLFDYWLYTMQYSDTAPSRIVAWRPDTGEVATLFDDPFGEVFSGATSAVVWNRTLVAGSAYGDGLLVCTP
ncbi:MAG: hypothetical protein AAF675_16065 [Pseudomonadota bacterium]